MERDVVWGHKATVPQGATGGDSWGGGPSGATFFVCANIWDTMTTTKIGTGPRFRSGRIPLRVARLASSLAFVAALAGCAADELGVVPIVDPGPGGGDSTVFVGFLLDGARQSGRLDITIESLSLAPVLPVQAAAAGARRRAPLAPTVPYPVVEARGRLTWAGGNVPLLGRYDFTEDTLYMTGTGRVLRGRYAGGTIRGDATTGSGPASFLAATDPSAPFVPWFGTFRAGATPDSGGFCFVHSGAVLQGMAFEAGAGAAVYFDGSVATGGNPKGLTFDTVVPTFFDASGSGSLDDNSGTASGTYDFSVTNSLYGSTHSGAWSAAR